MNPTTSARKIIVKPPDKGSFPIDHDNICVAFISTYLACLRNKHISAFDCRREQRDYLQCRMDNQLMAKTTWDKLGFSQDELSAMPEYQPPPRSVHDSPSTGTVSGSSVVSGDSK